MKSAIAKNFAAVTVLVFALITVITYFPALLGKVPFPRDMVLQFPTWSDTPRTEPLQHYADIGDLVTAFYPFRVFAARAVRDSTIPLWNPYFLSGAPFLASPQSALFYPPNFLYYVLPVPVAWTLCLMLRLFLSGIFMTLFVRTIGGSKAGSLFSGIVFAFSGFMTAWQGQPLADAATWLPFACYAVIRLQRRPSMSSVALAAFGFAMPVLAGHPETAAHVTLGAIAAAVFVWVYRQNTRFLLWFAAAGVLAVGLASIQIIPSAEWLGQMRSALDNRWPLYTLRDAFAWVSRDILRVPSSAGLWVPERCAYVGMITFPAAALGLLHRNRSYAIFLAVLTMLATAVAFGIEPVHWLVNHTPILASLKNARMVMVAGFGLAALAGLGVSALEDEVRSASFRRAAAFGLAIVAFLLVFLLVHRLQLATTFKVEFMRRPSFSRALLVIGLAPLLWRLHSGVRARMFPLFACVVVAFDMVTFAYGYTGFARADEIFPTSPVFDFLKKQGDASSFRVAQLGIPYSANANMIYDIASADGYEVLVTPQPRDFSLDYLDLASAGLNFVDTSLLKLNDRRLDMLNVKYLAVPKGYALLEQFVASQRFKVVFDNSHVVLLENLSALPRAFAVPASGMTVLNGTDLQLETVRSPSFDPQKKVIVSTLPRSMMDKAEIGTSEWHKFSSNVEITASGVNDLSLRTTTSHSAVLVISQNYYPGWRATVDGSATDVFAADLALTGIAVPAGVHEVRLVFRPTSFKIGAAVTSLAAVILVGLGLTTVVQKPNA